MSPAPKKTAKQPQYLTIDTFSETMSHIVTKEEWRGTNQDLTAKIDASHTELVGMLSEVLSQLQAMQENTVASDYRQGEHGAQLDNHEQRLLKVEHKLGLSF